MWRERGHRACGERRQRTTQGPQNLRAHSNRSSLLGLVAVCSLCASCLRRVAVCSFSPFLRGEGRGEGLSPRARFVENPLTPTLSPQAGRGSTPPPARLETVFVLHLPQAGRESASPPARCVALHLRLFRHPRRRP